jgi:glycosyltransferase involved in cell wall biosynthesis
MIGRISSWKGQDLFIDSAEEFVRRNPGFNVCFVIVGNAFRGQEWREQALRDRVKISPACSAFRLVGFRPDVADVLAGLDIFTMPSTRPDPFPNTVLEAMSASRAIVAVASGGVVEMLESDSGVLVEPNNVSALCEAWEHLAVDVRARETLGKAARERVEMKFSLALHLDRMQAMLREMMIPARTRKDT